MTHVKQDNNNNPAKESFMIMEPVIAGAFYPGDPSILRTQIEKFFKKAVVENKYKNTLGIISPHAGYTYSGQCAAYGFNVLKQKDFDLAVIIAPSHRHIGFWWSVGNFEAYRTPLGLATVHTESAEQLLDKEGFVFLPEVYRSENSLEVQIPFVQVIKPEAEILPILIGNQSRENSSYLAQHLAELLKYRLDKTVFIASSDLSHYHNSNTATEMDTKLAELVLAGDVKNLVKNIETRAVEACGFGSILTLLNLAKILGFDKIENLKYTHSGEISHDFSQVVGYLSTVVYK